MDLWILLCGRLALEFREFLGKMGKYLDQLLYFYILKDTQNERNDNNLTL